MPTGSRSPCQAPCRLWAHLSSTFAAHGLLAWLLPAGATFPRFLTSPCVGLAPFQGWIVLAPQTGHSPVHHQPTDAGRVSLSGCGAQSAVNAVTS